MDLQKRKQQLQEEYQEAIHLINQGVKARDQIEGALNLINEMEKEQVECAERENSETSKKDLIKKANEKLLDDSTKPLTGKDNGRQF